MSRHEDSEPGSLLPEQIGPYRIRGCVGRGGMGEVYRGYDSRLERPVAVKRVKPDIEDPLKARQRFRREARVMARLTHSAIVRIYDIVEDDGGDWIVMELVEGDSIRELLADGPLPPERVTCLGRGIADGLAAAHAVGLVHRDLKAGNVMVTDGDRIKILDFGLAKSIGRKGMPLQTTVSEQGLVIGTINAMSPEQALGKPVDHRSDLFSLGTLLYEMLTGVSPFQGENAVETLTRICTVREQPVRSLNPAVPEALGRLVGRLLLKDRERRPQTALEVVKALEILMDGSEDAPTGSAALDELATTVGFDDPTWVPDPPTPLRSSEPIGAGPRVWKRDSDGPVVLTLLMSDLVNSTRIVEQLGDERAGRLLGEHGIAARDLLAEHGGREIDSSDGFLLTFERPWAAVRYALAYHDTLATLAQRNELELAARVGIHLGEVVLRENPAGHVARGAKPLEVEGLAKPFAARLMSLARGGQTLLSRGAFDVARRAAQGTLPQGELSWLAHGAYLLKGIEDPVEVFEVGREGAAPLKPPPDSEKARQAVGDGTILGWRPATGRGVPQRRNWLLEHKLGEGGFGEVWLAQHQKTRERRVFKFCFEAGKLRALQREVTLFRLLKETLGARDDITPILDWNFDEAPYFLEREFTEGGTLADWVEGQGGIEGIPMPVRLELVAQVAEALAAAHSVGVLHKDVKPSNILVDVAREGRPQARITDFGIGRITERERLDAAGITALGVSLSEESPGGGTRLYMAPELLEGKPASIQADLYSLGVVLYQLVVGDLNRALAPGWRRDVDDDLLAEDIAALVDRSPNHRLASGQGLAWRLRELETRRAAHAKAEADHRALERASQRRKVLSAVAAVALVMLAVVSVFAVQAALARREAERSRARAEKLIKFMLGDLPKTLESAGPLDAMSEIADEVMEYFESLDPEDYTDDTFTLSVRALHRIGITQRAQGELGKAEAAFHAAERQAESLVSREPQNREWQAALADTRFYLGTVMWDRVNLVGAQERFESHRAIYAELVALQPDRVDWQLEVAYGHANLGRVFEARGEPEAAAEEYGRSMAIRQKLVASDPTNVELREALATSHNHLGTVLEKQGQLRGALEQYQNEFEILQRLASDTPEDARLQERLATSQSYVGVMLRQLGDIAPAEEQFRAAAARFAQLVERDASNVVWRGDLANLYRQVARMTRMRGDRQEAMITVRQSLTIFDDLLAKDPGQVKNRLGVAQARLLLAELLNDAGRPKDAWKEAQSANALLNELVSSQSENTRYIPWLSTSYALLARIETGRGKPESAQAAWREAVEVIEPLARDSQDVQVLDTWVRGLLGLGNRFAAQPIVERLLKLGYADPELMKLGREHGLIPEAGQRKGDEGGAVGPPRLLRTSGDPEAQPSELSMRSSGSQASAKLGISAPNLIT